ncbi:hypothetical protein [Hansschlegelia sp. KR7-227]|uniref:hypothetical protein n=1 Tax=Hansschlegelia sp. KR7-227 TaxID=3400914 RepID=UPI003C111DD4
MGDDPIGVQLYMVAHAASQIMLTTFKEMPRRQAISVMARLYRDFERDIMNEGTPPTLVSVNAEPKPSKRRRKTTLQVVQKRT